MFKFHLRRNRFQNPQVKGNARNQLVPNRLWPKYFISCVRQTISRGEDSIKASVGYDVNSINFAAAICLLLGVVLRENISLAVYRGDVARSRIKRGCGATFLTMQTYSVIKPRRRVPLFTHQRVNKSRNKLLFGIGIDGYAMQLLLTIMWIPSRR